MNKQITPTYVPVYHMILDAGQMLRPLSVLLNHFLFLSFFSFWKISNQTVDNKQIACFVIFSLFFDISLYFPLNRWKTSHIVVEFDYLILSKEREKKRKPNEKKTLMNNLWQLYAVKFLSSVEIKTDVRRPPSEYFMRISQNGRYFQSILNNLWGWKKWREKKRVKISTWFRCYMKLAAVRKIDSNFKSKRRKK